MRLTRRTALATGAASLLPLPALHAQDAEPIRIGVLTDLAGPYRDVTGPTSVACVRQAVEEFTAQNPGIRVEVVVADHQNKPDVALNICRQWFDRDGVDLVVSLAASSVALAVAELAAAHGVDMPIVEHVASLIAGEMDPEHLVKALISREAKPEVR